MSGSIEHGRARRQATGAFALVLLVAASLTPGCYTTQLGLLRSGLDSLRVQVDTLTVRDSLAYRVLAETRREMDQQRELLLSTRASSGSTMQEMFDQMGRLEGKLDDVMHRFGDWVSRSNTSSSGASSSPTNPLPAGVTPVTPVSGPTVGPAAATAAPDPTKLYDQATRDLTEGRYPLALQGYRDFLAHYPAVDLADNAQYGLAECFFAQAAFDSAFVAYGVVGERWPKGDRAAAALYKVGLCEEKLGRTADARKTFQSLVGRYPGSGEASLARERLGASHH